MTFFKLSEQMRILLKAMMWFFFTVVEIFVIIAPTPGTWSLIPALLLFGVTFTFFAMGNLSVFKWYELVAFKNELKVKKK